MDTSTDRTSSPPRRTTLSRQRVLEAALPLVDREGLDALSMRRLAAELDVEAMSLYTHVASKDDLLAGLTELVWDEIVAAAPPDEDWSAWLRSLGHAVRDAVRRHPNALPVLVSGDVCPVPALELFADELERAQAATVDRDTAVNALRTVIAFALGSAVTEQCCFGPAPSTSRNETERQRLVRISRALPSDTPDRLVDLALTVCGDTDTDRIFTDGLGLVIRGGDLR